GRDMTIGDVLGVAGGIIGIWLSTWALLILMALLFSRRATQAQAGLETRPMRAFWIGAALVATAGVVAIAFLSQRNGMAKLIGWILLFGLLGISALGAGGLVRLIGSRVQLLNPRLSELLALALGAAFLVIAGWVPLFGWFFIIPAVIITSLGAGIQVLFHREQAVPQAATTPVLMPPVPPPATIPPAPPAAPQSNIEVAL
ncbi:MAG: hypothetical protein M3347_16285, partial [Armatimonadota bacterium]|nr:hypothetical protein [Armatimonadota bacterium]